ncbi:MAG: PorT family protein [Saprospiraceae bacterium]|nr:PorT family protein [Saprospiraceae bacterium]
MVRILIALCFIALCVCSTFGQERFFYGGLKSGLSLSQIDGDDALGYDKLGVQAGIFGGFGLGGIKELQIEFLYSLRGSRSTKNDTANVKINLHYIDIPIIFCLKDWLIEDDKSEYYRIHFQGGISPGFLFNSSTLRADHQFKKLDISWLVGVQYNVSQNLGIYSRYTSSFTPLYTYQRGGEEIKMISYFISLGLNYRFN